MIRNLIGAAVLAAALPMLPAIPAFAAGTPAIVQPEGLTWGPAPNLPAGAQITVLYGDPSKTGPFAIRLKFPAGYEVPTHSHPTDELITVLSGKALMSFGENSDKAAAQTMGPGTFMSLPAGALHHLWVEDESVVELHSTGPFDTHVH